MTAVEARILDLYRHVGIRAAQWGNRVPLIADAGFRILSGPPVVGGPMVVSLNPGLTDAVRVHDANDFWPRIWPKRLSYLRGISAFARKFLQIFDGASIELENVNAGYVLVFRSNSIKEWRTKVQLDVREGAEQLSLEVLKEIVSILKLNFIYVAGFSTWKRMRCTVDRMEHGRRKSAAEFVLLRYGCFAGVPVVTSPHPSGSRLSCENMDQIALGLSVMGKY